MPCRSGCEDVPINYKDFSNSLLKENAHLKKRIEELEKLSEIEKVAFNSFMTVFLCKAMEIVVSNFGYKYLNSDLEWWFKEHKNRDNNNDESTLPKEVIDHKLLEIQKKYRVG